MKKIIFFFMLLISTHQSLFSQPKGSPDVGNAIERFKNTDFMVRFMDLKDKIEGEAVDFIKVQNIYANSDVRNVQTAYNKTAARFNQVTLDIKQDFMDKKKIKMINQFPQMYSDGLSNKINDLERFYKENFYLTLKETTAKNGSAILALIFELVKSTSELSNYFKGLKFEKDAMNEDYIQKKLIEPSKFKTWSELASGVKIDPASETPQKPKETSETKNDDIKKDEGKDKSENDSNKENNTEKNEKKSSSIEVDDASKIEQPQPIKVNQVAKKKSNN
jgi:hypothetical protein